MKEYLEQILSTNQMKFMDVLESNIQDFLDIDFSKILIVGNLPYYITSPIFRKFFGDLKCDFAG